MRWLFLFVGACGKGGTWEGGGRDLIRRWYEAGQCFNLFHSARAAEAFTCYSHLLLIFSGAHDCLRQLLAKSKQKPCPLSLLQEITSEITGNRQPSLVVIAEASRNTRYGTRSVVKTAVRDLIPTRTRVYYNSKH